MNKLDVLIRRLKKIGIETTYFSSLPWLYLDTINGKKVTERFASDHGFVIGFLNWDFDFTYSEETFILIRKYINDGLTDGINEGMKNPTLSPNNSPNE